MTARRPVRTLDRVKLPDDAGGHVGYVTAVKVIGPRRRRRRLLTVVTEAGVAFIESHHVHAA